MVIPVTHDYHSINTEYYLMMNNFDIEDLLSLAYVMFSLIIVVQDIFIAHWAYKEQRKYSHVLSISSVMAGMVQVTYLLSVFSSSYRAVSFFSSLYFICVDMAILSLLIFVRAHTMILVTGWNKWFKRIIAAIFVLDTIALLTNIFYEISVHYVYVGGAIARYSYEMKLPYWCHLMFSYVMVVMVIFRFYVSARRMPKEYRRPYYMCISVILLVVGLNALFLYYPSLFGEHNLDYSIWGYSLAAFLIYYLCYRYPTTGMKNYYHSWVVQNINQGVVLFNFEDSLIIGNAKMKQIFPDCILHEGMSIAEFSNQLNLDIEKEHEDDDYSLQHYVERDGKEIPIRFDHRCLKSESNDRLGQLFVFTDEIGDVDLLTSFFTWNYYNRDLKVIFNHYQGPYTVSACDLNDLHEINATFGKNVGDHAIKILANSMRMHFPRDAYFVRGQEANLIAFCASLDARQVAERLDAVRDELLHNNELGCVLLIQSAIGVIDDSQCDVDLVLQQTMQSMRNKKLLDENSYHSEVVSSLMKTLSECDPDTESHVKRTQELGQMLGKRLMLSDKELSDLALLCVLHDIGKIGIPLEILNKPDKLNASEWHMMQTHVEKGYQIARSSRELSHIAEMILHHHEHWNGTGYPAGLSKESIPLLSRVIAVVDSYDAMVKDRPYRKGVTREEAITELKACAGIQFDPRIVNEFILMIREQDHAEQQESKKDTNVTLDYPISRTMLDRKADVTEHVHQVQFCRYILENQWDIVEVDDQFEKLTGYSFDDVVSKGMTQLDLLPESDRTDYLSTVMEQKRNSSNIYLEHRLQKKDGTLLYVFCFGRSFYDSSVKKERSEIIVFDSYNTYAMQMVRNREKEKAKVRLEKWEDKYRCDSLTGLLNHEAYENDIELILLKTNQRVLFLMMDVDRFKEYNDSYGHRQGDEFLMILAQSLTSVLDEKDLACRMGGDEFSLALIYEPDTPEEVMFSRAEDICRKLNHTIAKDIGGCGISMGAVISDVDSKNFNDLYEHADQALYKAKEMGRGRMETYQSSVS